MNDNLTRALLTLLTVSFLAWAGVVYRGTNVVADGIQSVEIKVERIATQHERVRDDVEKHSLAIARAELDIARIRARLELAAPTPEYP
jgi:hypothetical protein